MNLPPTVCLDGAAVRRIREEKKLTQLYVAKVVGVTTDTISRWENNRYPTVRRENLLRLGEALEVEPELLMVGGAEAEECGATEPAAEGAEAAAVPTSRAVRRFLVPLLLVGGGALLLLFWQFSREAQQPHLDFQGQRLLPAFAAPGTVIPVRLKLSLADASRGYIVREHFPAGWELIEAVPPASSVDNEDGMARWIVKQGEAPAAIVYLLRVDARSPEQMLGRFRGEIIGNLVEKNLVVALQGDGESRVAPFNWADRDGNGQIDDNEMLEASQTFEEAEGVHLDWRKLESLWAAGSYRYDADNHVFLPRKP